MVDIKRQKKNAKVILAVPRRSISPSYLMCCFRPARPAPSFGAPNSDPGAGVTESSETPGGGAGAGTAYGYVPETLCRAGDPGNLYYIDGNHVLWGSGNNRGGQLGRGTQDNEF